MDSSSVITNSQWIDFTHDSQFTRHKERSENSCILSSVVAVKELSNGWKNNTGEHPCDVSGLLSHVCFRNIFFFHKRAQRYVFRDLSCSLQWCIMGCWTNERLGLTEEFERIQSRVVCSYSRNRKKEDESSEMEGKNCTAWKNVRKNKNKKKQHCFWNECVFFSNQCIAAVACWECLAHSAFPPDKAAAAAELGVTVLWKVKQYAGLCPETFIMGCNALLCLSVPSLFGQDGPSPENSRLLGACSRVW